MARFHSNPVGPSTKNITHARCMDTRHTMHGDAQSLPAVLLCGRFVGMYIVCAHKICRPLKRLLCSCCFVYMDLLCPTTGTLRPTRLLVYGMDTVGADLCAQ